MVSIVAAGQSKFGKRTEASLRDLAWEAVSELMTSEKGIDRKDIDATVIGVAGDGFSGQGAPAAVINDEIGMSGKPTLRVESACATGTAGIIAAYNMIEAGIRDTVLVVGVEKMSAVSSSEATELMARAGDSRWEFPFGVSFPGYYALMASAHMHKYGTTREILSSIGVKNHFYGNKNEKAHLRKEITLEEAMGAVDVATPLNLYDCSLISDGGAAVLVTRDDLAKKYTDTPIQIKGIGSGSDTMMMAKRKTLYELVGAQRAAAEAYKMAGLTAKDMSLAEVHDCFTIAELMAISDLGFFTPEEAGQAVLDKQTYIGGSTPVNIDGGLKSKGHPLGATGVSQAYEIRKQLLGEAGDRQVDGAEYGLSHNVGQSGQFVNVLIYGRG
ncbi:MAG: thiolase domain-containing protein [Candidatus Heimdallarchaeota archaeon]|nr:thiolase domain-containing protein [Candidatus Heimdallarchaeota archaeon]